MPCVGLMLSSARGVFIRLPLAQDRGRDGGEPGARCIGGGPDEAEGLPRNAPFRKQRLQRAAFKMPPDQRRVADQDAIACNAPLDGDAV